MYYSFAGMGPVAGNCCDFADACARITASLLVSRNKQTTANGSPAVLLVLDDCKDMFSMLMEGTDCVGTPANAEQGS